MTVRRRLQAIADCNGLHVAPFSDDGTTHGTQPGSDPSPSMIGCTSGPTTASRPLEWRRDAAAGQIHAAGADQEVTFTAARPDVDDAVDDAYRANRAGSRYLPPMLTDTTCAPGVHTSSRATAIGADMQQRTLGSDLTVSAVGLGCMTMTGGYGGNPDRHAMITLLQQAVDAGVTFFDTAETYGPHRNESLLGEALAGWHDQVTVATKFANHIDPDTHQATGRLLRPDEVAAAADGSLQRLGVETIDLYYQHRINSDYPIEDFAGAVKDLIDAGKVRRYGLSEAAAETIRRAHAVQPVTAVQSEYSLWWRRPEDSVLEVCQQLGIGFVPYSPLGKGFLTGTLDGTATFHDGDLRASIPRFGAEERQHNVRLVDGVRRIAADLDATPGQVALAWLLAQRSWIVPIPGTTKRDRLEENIAAADLTLDRSDVDRLTDLSDSIEILGARYPAFLEAQTNL